MPDVTAINPTEDDVLNSLAAAADAARQAYLAALAANPGADLSPLYAREMKALALWSDAEKKALRDDAAVADARAKLEAATKAVKGDLTTITSIATWMARLDNLVSAAAAVSTCFA